MLSRRSHNKSRLGCLQCKRRKVKCDEQKPACAQCSHRHLQCEYGYSSRTRAPRRKPSSSVGASTPSISESPSIPEPSIGMLLDGSPSNQSGSANTQPGLKMDKLDLRIFHTLLTSLPAEMKSTPESNSLQFWTKELPFLAFEHDFILHLSLALAAQFMVRHQRVEMGNSISLRASEHYQSALPSFIQKLSDVHDVQVLWVGSLLMCLHSFACGPRLGEYLMFSDNGDPEWNILFRGARQVWNLASSSTPAGERPTPSSYDTSPDLTVERLDEADTAKRQDRTSFFDWLHRFGEVLATLTVEEPSYAKYVEALDALEVSYVEQYGAPDDYEKPVRVVTHSTFAWLFRITDEFVAALQLKKSLALVIFAFYIPLLHDGKPRWLMQDWSHHILSGIQKHLNPHYSRWISWILQYTGYRTTNDPT